MPSFSSDRKAVLLYLESKVEPKPFEDGAGDGAGCRQRGSRGRQLPDPTVAGGPSSPRAPIPPCQHYSATTCMDQTPRSFSPASFGFTPVMISSWAPSLLWHLLPFPPTSHRPKPARSAKLSDSDPFFSAAFSLFDLLLFKLCSVMFYTIIDNKVAPEPFLTVLFFFFFEYNFKMTNASWFVSEKWK